MSDLITSDTIDPTKNKSRYDRFKLMVLIPY